ncbi:MAG: glutamate--cysteine ligase [Thiobacillaceae bacterium]
MGQEISQTLFAGEDYVEYDRRLRQEIDLLNAWLEAGRFSSRSEVGGYELECWLLDHNYFPAPINQAYLARLNNPLVGPELSCFNVELNGVPQPLRGTALSDMRSELQGTWNECQEVAHAMDSMLMMIGILPSIRQRDLCLTNMADLRRYRALNEQMLTRRAGRPLHIRIDGRQRLDLVHPDVMLEAAATSFQLHLQVPQAEAVRYFNASLIAAGPLLAGAVNSPYLFDHDLWDETRIPLFEQAVDGREGTDASARRVDFGCGYARETLFECFADNLNRHPVLLPLLMDTPAERFAHLRLHNGTIWRWVRPLIGFDPDGTPHLRIEQRVLPSGPSIADMLANAALYFGLVRFLAGLSDAPEEDFPFEHARANFYAAANCGLEAELHWLGGGQFQARTLLLEEILPMARQGLKTLTLDQNDIDTALDILQARITSGQTGAAWQRAYCRRHQADSLHLVVAYLERQRGGMPVHEWDI